MALIKRVILTSREVLYTKSYTRNQFFAENMLSKIWIFLASDVSLRQKKKEKKLA